MVCMRVSAGHCPQFHGHNMKKVMKNCQKHETITKISAMIICEVKFLNLYRVGFALARALVRVFVFLFLLFFDDL